MNKWSIELVAKTWEGAILVHSERACWRTGQRWKDPQSERLEITHGVSSMTRHTHAMVLRQSVVSSIGKVLFWRKEERERQYN